MLLQSDFIALYMYPIFDEDTHLNDLDFSQVDASSADN